MKNKVLMLSGLVVFLVSVFVSPGCKKDDDDDSYDTLSYNINKFIYGGMFDYYLWNDKVPDLSPTKFKSRVELDDYLKKTNDHEAFFKGLLYKYGTVDKWSWIVDDYVELENMFQGVTKSMGMEFMLFLYGTDKIFGVVEYVVKGGPADRAGVKRGDIFTKINNTYLTKDNYKNLLYDLQAYTLSFSYIKEYTIYQYPSSYDKSMVAEVVSENPILLDTVYTVNDKKVGYLVYNGFMNNYNKELNTVFGKFKDEGIQELIIDLRYNGGGSLYSCICLASMIYGKETSKIFVKTQFNSGKQNEYLTKYGPDYFNGYFTDSVVTNYDTYEAEPLNTLNLSRAYFITTNQTASASECLINGLKPYITVEQVGDSTTGKYVGSQTLYNAVNGEIVKTHHWAIQPIIFKYTNSQNVSDFTKGLFPTILSDEDITSLKPFGDTENEPMLKATLYDILGISTKSLLKSTKYQWGKFADSKDRNPHMKEIYMDKFYPKVK